jgi:hypothetical protein
MRGGSGDVTPGVRPRRTGLQTVTNGLAFGILAFFAALVFFGLLYAVMNVMTTELFALDIGGSQEVQTTQGYFNALWTYLPFILIIMLVARLIARAAFESRGGV